MRNRRRASARRSPPVGRLRRRPRRARKKRAPPAAQHRRRSTSPRAQSRAAARRRGRPFRIEGGRNRRRRWIGTAIGGRACGLAWTKSLAGGQAVKAKFSQVVCDRGWASHHQSSRRPARRPAEHADPCLGHRLTVRREHAAGNNRAAFQPDDRGYRFTAGLNCDQLRRDAGPVPTNPGFLHREPVGSRLKTVEAERAVSPRRRFACLRNLTGGRTGRGDEHHASVRNGSICARLHDTSRNHTGPCHRLGGDPPARPTAMQPTSRRRMRNVFKTTPA